MHYLPSCFARKLELLKSAKKYCSTFVFWAQDCKNRNKSTTKLCLAMISLVLHWIFFLSYYLPNILATTTTLIQPFWLTHLAYTIHNRCIRYLIVVFFCKKRLISPKSCLRTVMFNMFYLVVHVTLNFFRHLKPKTISVLFSKWNMAKMLNK